MIRTATSSAILFVGLLIVSASAAATPPPGTAGIGAAAVPPTSVTESSHQGAAVTAQIRVRPWQLYQSSGGDLYQALCSDCHGVAAEGKGSAGPRLTHLKQAGVPRSHWTYVLRSPCEDPHHRLRPGHQQMPCWQRAFRESLGNEAGALMVTSRLAAYIDSIQR